MATKSLVNLYWDLNPAMLETKDRGKMESMDMKLNVDFGISKISKEVDGIWLLASHEGWTEE